MGSVSGKDIRHRAISDQGSAKGVCRVSRSGHYFGVEDARGYQNFAGAY